MGKFGKQRDAQVAWEAAQLPGGVAGLFNARGSPNINGRISEGVLDDLPEEIT